MISINRQSSITIIPVFARSASIAERVRGALLQGVPRPLRYWGRRRMVELARRFPQGVALPAWAVLVLRAAEL
eukprot:11194907-Lingulodinium_polyedra.AAC.1